MIRNQVPDRVHKQFPVLLHDRIRILQDHRVDRFGDFEVDSVILQAVGESFSLDNKAGDSPNKDVEDSDIRVDGLPRLEHKGVVLDRALKMHILVYVAVPRRRHLTGGAVLVPAKVDDAVGGFGGVCAVDLQTFAGRVGRHLHGDGLFDAFFNGERRHEVC